MEPNEFQAILSELDGQIAAAKANQERRLRRDALERRLKEIEEQIAPVEQRVIQVRQLGEEPSERVLRCLAALRESAELTRKEIDSLTTPATQAPAPPQPIVQIPPPPAAPSKPPAPLPSPFKALPASDRQGFIVLMDEIERTDLRVLPPEDLRLHVVIWSLRWRQMVEAAGPESAEHDRDVRRCFARIAQERDRYRLEMIPALARNGTGDWARERARAEAALRDLREQREAALARETRLFSELRELMGAFPSHADLKQHQDSPEARRFRHLAREIGRSEHLRDQLSEMCRPYRPALEPEFSFLWRPEEDDEDEVVQTGRRLTNHDIMRRLLRRMIRKGIIGGKTCPTDMLFRGFPQHDVCRAKEALEILARVGAVVISKAGDVAAISTGFLKEVKAFVEAGVSGIEAVDTWASADDRVAQA